MPAASSSAARWTTSSPIPRSAYTLGLLRSLPDLAGGRAGRRRLHQIEGAPPDMRHLPPGDPFAAAQRLRDAALPRPRRRPWSRRPAPPPGHLVAAWYDLPALLAPEGRADERTSAATPLLVGARPVSKHYPLRTWWGGKGSVFRAVEGVSFDIRPGETLGLVGESGSGKSTIGRAVTMLNPPTSGTVAFEGTDLAKLRCGRDAPDACPDPDRVPGSLRGPQPAHERRRLRRRGVQAAPARRWRGPSGATRSAGLFERVGLDPRFAGRYPHQFSGGQRQRICIARAIALKPSFIVADEPIAALDVSIQAQVVNLLQDLQDELGLSYLFISHDLRMVRYLCHASPCSGAAGSWSWPRRTPSTRIRATPTPAACSRAVPVPNPAEERARLAARDIADHDQPPDGPLTEVAPGHWAAMPQGPHA